MQDPILDTIYYFANFDYNPNFEEIYTYLSKKISRHKLNSKLSILTAKGVIKKHCLDSQGNIRYTIGEYQRQVQISPLRLVSNGLRGASKDHSFRYSESGRKIKIIQNFIKIITLFPQIKLAGLSGSVAMMNADYDDDIDMFIISTKNRLWTARMICLTVSQLLGIRRVYGQKKAKDKICLNLFFDEGELAVPKYKQTVYVGHELLQMKPLINKGNIYEQFIQANKWVFKLFPNAKLVLSSKYQVSSIKYQVFSMKRKKQLTTYYLLLNTVAYQIEQMLKKVQLYQIQKHRTTEIITNTKLWFFPHDYEHKINK